jgi:hypothetical protein
MFSLNVLRGHRSTHVLHPVHFSGAMVSIIHYSSVDEFRPGRQNDHQPREMNMPLLFIDALPVLLQHLYNKREGSR